MSLKLFALAAALLVIASSQRTVRLGYIATRTYFGEVSIGGFQAELAVRAAMEYCKDVAVPAANIQFEMVTQEASANVGRTPAKACSAAAVNLRDSDVDVVIGPPSSSCSGPSASILGAAGIPQLSHSATSEFLKNTTLYPTFFRIPPSDADQGNALARLINDCAFGKIGFIASDDSWASGLIKTIRGSLQPQIDTSNEQIFAAGDSDALEQAMERLFAGNTAVNVILALRTDVLAIMSKAREMGMVREGWTWLAPDGLTTQSLDDSDFEGFDGLLGIRPLSVSGPLSVPFHTFDDSYDYHNVVSEVGIPSFSARILDAVLGVSLAVANTTNWESLSLTDRRLTLLSHLRSFRSLETGYAAASRDIMYFDESQGGPPAFEIVNVIDGEFVAIGTFVAGQQEITQPVQWSTLGPDGLPLTGFGECPPLEATPNVPTTTTLLPRVTVIQNSSSDDGLTTGALIAIIAMSILAVILIILVFVLRRMFRNRNSPYDFKQEIEKFVELGGNSETSVKPLELKRRDIIQGEIIGQGNSAKVMLGTYRDPKSKGNQEVAIKMVKSSGALAEEKSLLQEAAFMAQLNHPHLLKLVGVVSVGRPVLLVSEYCKNGSLDDFLQRSQERRLRLALSAKIRMAIDVADAVEYLHERNLIHRDIAGRNVLVDDAGECKLADFGLSRNNDYATASDKPLPIKWTAPESLVEGTFTKGSDAWAFGVFLVELTTNGQQPYPFMTNEAVRVAIISGVYRHPRLPEIPVDVYDLMQRCWFQDPNERPPLSAIKAELEALEEMYELSDLRSTSGSMTHVMSFSHSEAKQGKQNNNFDGLREESGLADLPRRKSVTLLDGSTLEYDDDNHVFLPNTRASAEPEHIPDGHAHAIADAHRETKLSGSQDSGPQTLHRALEQPNSFVDETVI